MAKFLNYDGMLYFYQKLTGKFVAKESGKGLSTNDFTAAYKEKLDGIAPNANNYTLPTASSTTLGGVKIGTGLAIGEDGTLRATGGGTADAVAWANVQNKPTTIAGYGITDAYTKSEIDGRGYLTASDISGKADKSTTLAGYGITDAYTKSEVYTKEEINARTSAALRFGGSILFSELPEATANNVGFVFNIEDSFTIDERFVDYVEGAEAVPYPIGTNVSIIAVEGAEGHHTYMYDVTSGFMDLSPYMKKTDMTAITNGEIDSIFAA